MEKDTPPANTDDQEPPSPVAQVQALVADVRALAEAELDYAKARLSYSGGILRKAGIWALLAIFFLSGAVVALILGLLLIVSHYAGPWIATAVVVTVFIFAAWAAAVVARRTANNLKFDDGQENA